jgi:hypothetical protein
MLPAFSRFFRVWFLLATVLVLSGCALAQRIKEVNFQRDLNARQTSEFVRQALDNGQAVIAQRLPARYQDMPIWSKDNEIVLSSSTNYRTFNRTHLLLAVAPGRYHLNGGYQMVVRAQAQVPEFSGQPIAGPRVGLVMFENTQWREPYVAQRQVAQYAPVMVGTVSTGVRYGFAPVYQQQHVGYTTQSYDAYKPPVPAYRIWTLPVLTTPGGEALTMRFDIKAGEFLMLPEAMMLWGPNDLVWDNQRCEPAVEPNSWGCAITRMSYKVRHPDVAAFHRLLLNSGFDQILLKRLTRATVQHEGHLAEEDLPDQHTRLIREIKPSAIRPPVKGRPAPTR